MTSRPRRGRDRVVLGSAPRSRAVAVSANQPKRYFAVVGVATGRVAPQSVRPPSVRVAAAISTRVRTALISTPRLPTNAASRSLIQLPESRSGTNVSFSRPRGFKSSKRRLLHRKTPVPSSMHCSIFEKPRPVPARVGSRVDSAPMRALKREPRWVPCRV